MLCALAASCWAVGAAGAQHERPSEGPERVVTGRVTLVRAGREVGRPGAWVVLHRVGRESAAPVDSVRAGPGGAFRLAFRPWGDSGAVYFVTSMHHGIAYFSSSVGDGAADAGVVLFDTTSRPVPLPIASRHVIVGLPDSAGSRRVIEVAVVLNPGELTRVATRAGDATFELPLPTGAVDPRIAEGDVPPDGATFSGGWVRVLAPFAPGSKRIAFSYRMRAGDTELTVPPAGAVDLLEVLVEDSSGTASGSALAELAPTSINGRTFRRFAASDVADGQPVRVRVPAAAPGGPGINALIVAAAAATLVATLAIALRRPAAVGDDVLAPADRTG